MQQLGVGSAANCCLSVIVKAEFLRQEKCMVSMESRVKPNQTEVAAKVIDGEAIIMNLSNGLYFSMEHVGAAVWELVERECSLGEMVEAIVDRYDTDTETASADVLRLVNELLREALVVTTEKAPEGGMPVGTPSESLASGAPVLNKYSDMADLLALDPPMPGLGDTEYA